MSGAPRPARLLGGGATLGGFLISWFAGCSSSDPARPALHVPPSAVSDAPLALVRRFPTAANPGVRMQGCLFASPLAVARAVDPAFPSSTSRPR